MSKITDLVRLIEKDKTVPKEHVPLSRMNINLPWAGENTECYAVTRKNRGQRITPEQRASILRMYNDGHPVRKITQEVGVSRDTVYQSLAGREKRKFMGGLQRDDLKEMLDAREKGKPITWLSERYGLSVRQIYNYLYLARKLFDR